MPRRDFTRLFPVPDITCAFTCGNIGADSHLCNTSLISTPYIYEYQSLKHQITRWLWLDTWLDNFDINFGATSPSFQAYLGTGLVLSTRLALRRVSCSPLPTPMRCVGPKSQGAISRVSAYSRGPDVCVCVGVGVCVNSKFAEERRPASGFSGWGADRRGERPIPTLAPHMRAATCERRALHLTSVYWPGGL